MARKQKNRIDNLLKKLKKIKWRSYAKPFLIILCIYCFAMLAIWRSGVSYIDDHGRAISGKGWTSDFNRYSSSFLSFVLLQMRLSLVDISPLSQIVAMIFLAVATLIIVELFGDKRRISHLIVASLIGVTPFTLSLWLYKFDAPCMALALLASVLPFAFNFKEKLHFTLFSFGCLMVMMTSYQAFAGVFPLILVALAFRDYLDKKKFDWYRFVAGCIAFVSALFAFKFALPELDGYRSTEIFGLGDFVPGVLRNSLAIFGRIIEVFSINWLVVLSVLLVSFSVSIFLNSRRKGWKRVAEVLIAVIFVVVSVPISYGLYLALVDAPLNSRSLIGIGVVFAIVALLTLRGTSRKIFAISGVALFYLFCAYAFALGNALEYQNDYSRFRNTELALRLSELYPSSDELAKHKIQIQGVIGLARQAQHVAELYPITYDIIDYQQVGLGALFWSSYGLWSEYGLEYNILGSLEAPYDCGSMTERYDGLYERISEKNELVCVEIKNSYKYNYSYSFSSEE